MLNIIAGPIIQAIAIELIEKTPGKTEIENQQIAKDVIKKHLPKFWKQKRFYIAALVLIVLILNQVFGWNIPVDSLVCSQ